MPYRPSGTSKREGLVEDSILRFLDGRDGAYVQQLLDDSSFYDISHEELGRALHRLMRRGYIGRRPDKRFYLRSYKQNHDFTFGAYWNEVDHLARARVTGNALQRNVEDFVRDEYTRGCDVIRWTYDPDSSAPECSKCASLAEGIVGMAWSAMKRDVRFVMAEHGRGQTRAHAQQLRRGIEITYEEYWDAVGAVIRAGRRVLASVDPEDGATPEDWAYDQVPKHPFFQNLYQSLSVLEYTDSLEHWREAGSVLGEGDPLYAMVDQFLTIGFDRTVALRFGAAAAMCGDVLRAFRTPTWVP